MLPARAGMVRGAAAPPLRLDRAPRSRGDGPFYTPVLSMVEKCSPLARGWSPALHPRPQSPGVLPARAGMVRHRRHLSLSRRCAPRSRGDGPRRGWRRWGGGGAPRSRGDGPPRCSRCRTDRRCSPLARGWSARPGRRRRCCLVLPARAGMVPTRGQFTTVSKRAPRSRGDGPGTCYACGTYVECSPLARGWSPGQDTSPGRGAVLPARAGMVLIPSAQYHPSGGAPRSRGDGPRVGHLAHHVYSCSPLARGWSGGAP